MRVCFIRLAGQSIYLAPIGDRKRDKVIFNVIHVNAQTGDFVFSASREGYVGIRERLLDIDSNLNLWGYATLRIANIGASNEAQIIVRTEPWVCVFTPDNAVHAVEEVEYVT